MPTPAGLPRAGDRLRHTQSGRVFEVVKRESNGALYSLILRPADGQLLPANAQSPYGYPGCFRLLEASYWLGRTWFFVLNPPDDPGVE